jgi:putative transposase
MSSKDDILKAIRSHRAPDAPLSDLQHDWIRYTDPFAQFQGLVEAVGGRGKVAILAENHLKQDFDAEQPNQVWVTDITYIRTYEGWLFLAVVIDLFSRQVVGWSMQPRMHVDLVLNALLMAVWRRKPKNEVLIHSDQGSQYTSSDWQAFLKSHNLVCSMSRRGNCYDNAVAESFFQLLKRERVKRKTYKDREEARQDIFNYIEMFYNPIRRHGYNDDLSPAEFERRHLKTTASV